MIADPVTTRYAGALYELARKKNVLADVERDVEALAGAVAAAATRSIVFNPRVEREAKRAQLGPELARMHAFTRNLVNLLLDKNREEVLRGLAEAFRRRLLEDRGAVEGIAESARPLESRELDAIATSVGARLQKRVQLTNRVVPELVGGVRVTAANRMIDASVKGRLEGLRRQMMDVRLPSAAGR